MIRNGKPGLYEIISVQGFHVFKERIHTFAIKKIKKKNRRKTLYLNIFVLSFKEGLQDANDFFVSCLFILYISTKFLFKYKLRPKIIKYLFSLHCLEETHC